MTKNLTNTTSTSTMKKGAERDAKNKRVKVQKPTPLREYVPLDVYLAHRARERQEKHATIIKDYFPDIHTLTEPCYHGVLSWTLPQRRERWIKPGAVVNIGNGIQTGGEIARDYLDWKYPDRLRATKAQVLAIKEHRSAPLYCEPSVLEHGAYVDLSAAYWSIMSLIGWDVDYYPGKWLVAGECPDDFPLREHKVARNALVSAGLPTPVKYWTGSEDKKLYTRNPHINMGLWAAIMDILHSIGGIARSLGAIYVHTDGYILEAWEASTLIGEIERFGLHASIKASGVSVVLGMGNYRCGDKSTKAYGAAGITGNVEYIYRTHSDKLREKLDHLSRVKGVKLRRQAERDMRE